MEAPVLEIHVLPPVEFEHARDAPPARDTADAERNEEERGVPSFQRLDARQVQMIVVVMRDQHEVDRGEVGRV